MPYLVTGASGGLGSVLVDRLLATGERVRVMVRRLPEKPRAGLEYALGDLGDPAAVERAVRGAETVFHVGAAMKGGWLDHQGGTVEGTRNVIAACRQHGVRKLVHVSSMSVIDWAGADAFAPVDEQTPLESRAEERGSYTQRQAGGGEAGQRGGGRRVAGGDRAPGPNLRGAHPADDRRRWRAGPPGDS